jgi:hypothetical protein
MKTTKLAKAIALTITGAALTGGMVCNAAASSTTYNTFNAYASNIKTDASAGATDGWTVGSPNPNGGTWATVSGWTSASAPFATTSRVVNWAASLTTSGDSLTVSSQNAHDQYGVWADIDTAKGAWQDASATPTGWAHNTDVGLFKSDVTTQVTLKLTTISDTETWSNFGVTVFAGMSSGAYNHHNNWNCPTCAGTQFKPYDANNPMGGTGLTYLTHDATVDAINGLTFTAQAGQVYSILLGGNSGNGNFDPHAGYSMSITSAPAAVPVPAAVWLFGSAIAGLVGVGRKKKQV